MKLREIMSAPVVTIPPSTTVGEARAAMERAGIRHLVVVVGRRQQLTGVVSARDLRRGDDLVKVQDLMSSPVVTSSPATTVAEAARLLRAKGVGCLPVMDRNRLAGIVTVSDLLAQLGKGTLRVQARTEAWTLPRRGPTHRPVPRRA
ncbi:MAG: CBS domain-containing protein [Myxococcales bacterium]